MKLSEYLPQVPQMQQQMAEDQGPPPGANPMDQQGGGGSNIGIGAVPVPGEKSFSGAQPQQGVPNAPQPRQAPPAGGQPTRLQ